MSPVAFQKPVEDSVRKVNDEVAVGEDLEFQRKWWRFERVVWIVFLLVLLCDVAGLFGRGPLAHARASNPAMQLRYERFARFGTPSVLEVKFDPSAFQDGKYTLFVSESIVDELGAQRVIPSPQTTMIGNGGLTYTFPALPGKAAVQFALEPAKIGDVHFTLQVPGTEPIEKRVIVMP